MSMEDIYDEFKQPEIQQPGTGGSGIITDGNGVSSSASIPSSIPSSENDHFPQEQSGFHFHFHSHGDKNSHEHGKLHHLIRWKSGKAVDPRLLTLLKLFRELFVDRHDFFRKIFPGIHQEYFAELFKKIDVALTRSESDEARKKIRTVQRSRSLDFGQDSNLSLERFKVRTPIVMIGAQGDAANGGDGGLHAGKSGRV
ncbi:hypothetical protein U1Q18_015147 [Sarracenia purpurea var. burkii]